MSAKFPQHRAEYKIAPRERPKDRNAETRKAFSSPEEFQNARAKIVTAQRALADVTQEVRDHYPHDGPLVVAAENAIIAVNTLHDRLVNAAAEFLGFDWMPEELTTGTPALTTGTHEQPRGSSGVRNVSSSGSGVDTEVAIVNSSEVSQ
jgi:hypothetical protein